MVRFRRSILARISVRADVCVSEKERESGKEGGRERPGLEMWMYVLAEAITTLEAL